jgi:NodT family efflux transporter outer membrane factor (OMF) lipoprotein
MRTDLSASPRRLAAAALAATLLGGCAVGPDFQRPQTPAATQYLPEPLAPATASAPVAAGEAQRFHQGRDLPRDWWHLFQSPALDALIDQALKNSPSILAAEAALKLAHENMLAQQASFFPAVSVNFNPTRQQVPTGSLTTSAASGAALYNLHTAQLNISYVPDLFGGTRRAVESLSAQADSQRFQLEAAQLALTSNVVVAAIQEASLRAQLTALQNIVDAESRRLELLRGQESAGAAAGADVVNQEAALAQVRSAIPLLKKQLAQQRDLIAALAGSLPADFHFEGIDLASFRLPQDLPLSLPSKLVAQRPDVRSAEEQLHAASAQIGVAQANRLPQLTLSAGIGSSATALSQLFKSGNGFWNLGAGLTQPLFDGGALLHRKLAAEAAYEQAEALYRNAVITAFQNVADALTALQFDAEALAEAYNAERAAFKSLEVNRRQLELGDAALPVVLAAEHNYQQALLNLVQAQASRLSDTAGLFAALGGGWWKP